MVIPSVVSNRLNQIFCLADGRTLAYAEYGAPEGRPVFYFHGLSGSRLEPAILDGDRFTAAGLRLIACDRPGMGRSDFQPGRGFCQWPADVVEFAGSLGLDAFALLGISGGGGYISACARLIPERLTAAVIVSGVGLMNAPETRASIPAQGRLVWELAARSPRLTGVLLQLTKPDVQADPAKIRQRVLQSMSPVEAAVFDQPGRLQAFIASGTESMRQGVKGIAWDTHVIARSWDFRLEEIRFPVRLFHGEDDRSVPVAVARQVAAAIPGCRATFYPGEGHFSTVVNHLDEIIAALN